MVIFFRHISLWKAADFFRGNFPFGMHTTICIPFAAFSDSIDAKTRISLRCASATGNPASEKQSS